MLAPDHADRRQLSDLVAPEPQAGPALLLAEPMPASTARVRVVIDELIDLILGPQLPTGPPMPGLPTSLTLSAFSAHQFLRLRPRLRPPLRPRLRWIHRRRRRTRARVAPYLLLEPLQSILVLLKPPRKTKNELDTRLTP